MRRRAIAIMAAAIWGYAAVASGQAVPNTLAGQYVDPVNGLTLEQAIEQALAREPSLQASRAEVDVARALEHQAGLRVNPTVVFERTDEPGGMDSQSMVSVQWPLELFRRQGRQQVAARTREVASFAAADRERLLAADVRARYGAVLVAVRDLAVLDEIVTAVARQRDLVSSRVAEGAARALDRDLIEVELRRWRADRLVRAGEADAALLALKRGIGLPPEAPLALREDLITVVTREHPVPSADAEIDARSDVAAAAARVGAAEARHEDARRQGRIDLSVMASYARMNAGFMQRGFAPDGRLEPIRNQMHYVSAGLMVMLPLFDRNQGGVAAAAAERVAATAALDAARLEAAAELASAEVVDRRAREALDLFTSGARDLALRNLEVVRETYALGRATIFDVVTEQRRYLDFERAYTDALRRAYEARTALLAAQGGTR